MEKERVVDTLAIIVNRLHSEKKLLSEYTYDLSDWEDTYQFIEHGGSEYPDINLTDDSLTPFNVQYFAIVDAQLNILWHKEFAHSAIDLEGDEDPKLEALVRPRNSQVYLDKIEMHAAELRQIESRDDAFKEGFLWAEDMSAYAIRPVYSASGESNGFLMVVKTLDALIRQEIAEELKVDFSIMPIEHLADAQQKVQRSLRSSSYHTDMIRAHDIVASDDDHFLISTDIFPSYIDSGMGIARVAFIVFLLSILLASVALFIGFHLAVLRPLLSLRENTFDIINTHNYSLRTLLKGKDAISQLGRAFDQLLNLVQTEQQRLSDSNQKLSAQRNALEHMQEQLQTANARLEEMALRDNLTGIANRHALQIALENNWQSLCVTGQTISLILLDVDFFKRFNDINGHTKGDACLQKIAKTLSSVSRGSSDLAVRYGGEEFLLFLPSADERVALDISLRIQTNIAELAIPHGDSDVGDCVTVSLGISTMKAGGELTAATLITQADKALYRAKELGRNRIECFTK